MSIRMMAAVVTAAAAMVIAMCGTAVAATSRAASPAAQLTGVQLLSALLPQSDFPAGYKFDKSSAFDSGRHLENAPAQLHLSTMSCKSFAYHFSGTGFGETATASDGFEKDNYTSDIEQLVYQFKTASTAVSFYRGLFAIAHRCRPFVLYGVANNVLTHVFTASPIGGHRTFEVNESGSSQGLLIAVDNVITVAGTDVFYTANLGIAVAPPSRPSARTTMLRLIKRVEAFR